MASDDDDSGCSLDEFSWIPPGLTPSQVLQFMSCLPHNRIPYIGSVGDKYRVRQLVRQLPPQDIDASCCQTLSDEEKKELWLFGVRRRQEALGRGTVKELTSASDAGVKCEQCQKSMANDSVAVQATRAGDRFHWHPGCFVCHVCRELLVDLIYFYHEGKLFCGRHHAETLKPRCAACDEIIFGDECIEAEGRSWHMRHFVCAHCSRLLGGQRYVMRDESPYCCACFEHLFADRCQTCQQPISVDKGQLTSAGLHWHATDGCFSCSDCRRSLLGTAFVPRNGQILCSQCSNRQTSSCGEDQDSSISNNSSSSLRHQHQLLLLQQSSDAILKKQTSCRRADVAQNITAGAVEHCASERVQGLQGAKKNDGKDCPVQYDAVNTVSVKQILVATAVEKPGDETMTRRIGEIEKLPCFQPDSYMISSSNKTPGKTNPEEQTDGEEATLNSVLRNSVLLSPENGQTRPTRHRCSKILKYDRGVQQQQQQQQQLKTANSATSLRSNSSKRDSVGLKSTNTSNRKNTSVHFDASTEENGPSTREDLRSGWHRLTSYASDTGRQHEEEEGQNVALSTVLGPCPPPPPHVTPAGDGNGTPMLNRVPRLGVRQLWHAVSASAVPHNDSSADPGGIAPLTPRVRRTGGGRVRTDGYFSDIDRESWTRQRRLDGGPSAWQLLGGAGTGAAPVRVRAIRNSTTTWKDRVEELVAKR